MPADVAKLVLDRCVERNTNLKEFMFDYEFLEEFEVTGGSSDETDAADGGSK